MLQKQDRKDEESDIYLPAAAASTSHQPPMADDSMTLPPILHRAIRRPKTLPRLPALNRHLSATSSTIQEPTIPDESMTLPPILHQAIKRTKTLPRLPALDTKPLPPPNIISHPLLPRVPDTHASTVIAPAEYFINEHGVVLLEGTLRTVWIWNGTTNIPPPKWEERRVGMCSVLPCGAKIG